MRPALPARCTVEDLLAGIVTRACTPASKKGIRARHGSTTKQTPLKVIEVSAIDVATITCRSENMESFNQRSGQKQSKLGLEVCMFLRITNEMDEAW